MRKLREIIYLDADRVTSLLSQMEEGIAERSTDELAEAIDDLAGGEARILSRVSERVVRTREVRYFDHLVNRFLELASPPTVSGLDRPALADLLRSGMIVRFEGVLQITDYGRFGELLDRTKATMDGLVRVAAKGSPELTVAEKMRGDLERTRKQLEAPLKALFGDTIEFALRLADGQLARGVAVPDHLREPAGTLVARYGARASGPFCIVGIVSDTTVATRPSFSGKDFRELIWGFHETMRESRSMLSAGEADDGFSIVPIVVFRDIEWGRGDT